MAGHLSSPGATVTGRALALLGAFDEEHRELSLTELARRTDLPLTTAHRLVAELVAWGALDRNPVRRDDPGGSPAGAGRPRRDQAYVIGRRLWDLGLLAPVQADLVEVASPFLHDLYGATLATVHLAVRDGLEALYLHRLRGNTSVPIVSTVGSRLPLHATGVGKVLLAHAPAEVQQAALADLRRVTPYTITQPGRLRRQLDAIRRDDHATTVEEMSLGACSVGVPVRRTDAGGEMVVAAVGIVVPSLTRDRARLVAASAVAARGIGRALSQAQGSLPTSGSTG